jgi:hypothetical protein
MTGATSDNPGSADFLAQPCNSDEILTLAATPVRRYRHERLRRRLMGTAHAIVLTPVRDGVGRVPVEGPPSRG